LDIVYVSLDRRTAPEADPAGEIAEAVGALWAHATAEDGLEHVSGHAGSSRLDLLLYLLVLAPGSGPAVAAPCATERAAALLARCHRASPVWRRRYLPPPVAGTAPDPDRPVD